MVLRRSNPGKAYIYGGIISQGGYTGGGNYAFKSDALSGVVAAHWDKQIGNHGPFTGEDGVAFPLNEYRDNRNASLHLAYGGNTFLFNGFKEAYPHLGNGLRASGGGGHEWDEKGYLFKYGFTSDLTDSTTWGLSLVHDQGDRNFISNAAGTQEFQIKSYRRNYALFLRNKGASSFDWEFGADRETRTSEMDRLVDRTTGATLSESGLKDVSLTESSLFAQATYTWARWTVMAGSRYTKNDAFGSNVASRLTLVYNIAPQHSLKFIAGQSFRSPTLLERYLTIPGLVVPNPGVKPETSDSFEIEYLVSARGWFLQAQVYHMSVKDQLARRRRYPEFTSDPNDRTLSYINGTAFHSDGLELEIKYQPRADWDAFLNANFVHGDDGDASPAVKGYNNKFVPTVFAKAGVSKRFSAFDCSILGLHQGATDGPLGPIPSWTSFGLHLGHVDAWGQIQIRHSFDVRNAADRERDFPENARRNLNSLPDGMGRSVRYTLTLRF